MSKIEKLTRKDILIDLYNRFLEKLISCQVDIYNSKAEIIALPHERQKDIVAITQATNKLKEIEKGLARTLRGIDELIKTEENIIINNERKKFN
jgi:hypothetical protein